MRGRLASLGRTIRRWRAFSRRAGIDAPIWVTEHGYPSEPRFQTDPRFDTGEPGQAAYLRRSIAALVRAGAARVFVTERDNLGGAFASEGLLGGDVRDPPSPTPLIKPKPAAAMFARLTSRVPVPDARPRSRVDYLERTVVRRADDVAASGVKGVTLVRSGDAPHCGDFVVDGRTRTMTQVPGTGGC